MRFNDLRCECNEVVFESRLPVREPPPLRHRRGLSSSFDWFGHCALLDCVCVELGSRAAEERSGPAAIV